MLQSDSINWFPIINWSNLWVTLYHGIYICLPYYMWDMKTSSKSVFVQHGALETAQRCILPSYSPARNIWNFFHFTKTKKKGNYQSAQNQPNSHLLFHNNVPLRSFYIMTLAEILTVLFIGSEFWQLGFTKCFFMGTEYSKTLGCRGSRGR